MSISLSFSILGWTYEVEVSDVIPSTPQTMLEPADDGDTPYTLLSISNNGYADVDDIELDLGSQVDEAIEGQRQEAAVEYVSTFFIKIILIYDLCPLRANNF
jgi:hypothetical protein